MSLPDLARPQSSYREFAPSEPLRNAVICFWHRTGSDLPAVSSILPDGCIDIVWIGEQPPFVAGPMTKAAVSDIAAGVDVLGVRFQPGVAPAIFGVAAWEMRDRRVACADLWPGAVARAWGDVPARDTLAGCFAALNDVIARQMGTSRPPDAAVMRAARWLGREPAATLAALAQCTGLSERQLRRRFDAAVGFGPKSLQRILRLQRLLWIASQPVVAPPSLSQLAFAAGYADQPHMTRDVAMLTGSTPGLLLLPGQAHSAVADLFKT